MTEFYNYVRSTQGRNIYNILLLLTDGIINDMPQTRKTIVDLSSLPCSIIIVGVGSADFTQMEELDGDGGVLRDQSGRPCERDIVQFVKFNECVVRGNLAEEVLKEIPTQFCGHMEKIGFVPNAVNQFVPAGVTQFLQNQVNQNRM